MLIARNAQVVGAADVGAKFEGVVALNLGPVVDELDLFLIFVQRAVTAVHAQRVAELKQVVAVIVDEECRHAAGVGFVEIQSRDARIRGWAGVEAVRDNIHFVAEETEAEIREQIRMNNVIESRGDAVVQRIGSTGKGADAAARIIPWTARQT